MDITYVRRSLQAGEDNRYPMYCVGAPRNRSSTTNHNGRYQPLGSPCVSTTAGDRKPSPGAVYVRPLLCLCCTGLYSIQYSSVLVPHGLSFLLSTKKVQDRHRLSHENMIGGEGMVWSACTPNRVCRCSVLTRRELCSSTRLDLAVVLWNTVAPLGFSLFFCFSVFFLFSRSAVHCTIVQEWNASPSKASVLMHKVWPRLGDWVNRHNVQRSAYFPYETRVQG